MNDIEPISESLPAYQGRDDLDPRLVPVRRERWARELAELRLDYAMLDAWNAGATIADIAKSAQKPKDWVTAQVSDLVTEPPPLVEGRVGRRPLEVAYMYALGEISREQFMDELTTWPYEPEPVMGPYDEYEPEVPGAFQEVFYAYFVNRLVSREECSELQERISAWEASR